MSSPDEQEIKAFQDRITKAEAAQSELQDRRKALMKLLQEHEQKHQEQIEKMERELESLEVEKKRGEINLEKEEYLLEKTNKVMREFDNLVRSVKKGADEISEMMAVKNELKGKLARVLHDSSNSGGSSGGSGSNGGGAKYSVEITRAKLEIVCRQNEEKAVAIQMNEAEIAAIEKEMQKACCELDEMRNKRIQLEYE